MDYNFKESLSIGGVALRWMTANCYEIKLPGGKTIITDPFLPPAEGGYANWNHYSSGLTVDDLEGADYVLITHPHGDHIGSLPELFDRFHPRIFCHSSYAVHMSTDLHIHQQMIIPFENNQIYQLEDFTLETALARHSYGDYVFQRFEEMRVPDKGTCFETLNIYGAMINSNFIITAKNNLKIAVCAGTFETEERNRWKNSGINVLLRQCGSYIRSGNVEAMVKDIMDVGAEITLPLHHESIYGTADIIGFTDQVNEKLAAAGFCGRMFMPERNRWYKLGMAIELK